MSYEGYENYEVEDVNEDVINLSDDVETMLEDATEEKTEKKSRDWKTPAAFGVGILVGAAVVKVVRGVKEAIDKKKFEEAGYDTAVLDMSYDELVKFYAKSSDELKEEVKKSREETKKVKKEVKKNPKKETKKPKAEKAEPKEEAK